MYSKTFLISRTRKLIKKDQIVRDSIGFREAKFIGILFTADTLEKFEKIKELVKDMEDLGKSVDVLSYLPKGKSNYEFLFNIFTSQDLSFFGKFTNKDVTNFANKKFDYLLCLDTNLSPIIENVMAMSQAHCRMGCHSENSDQLFEFMIRQDNTKSVVDLIRDLGRYLKNLTKESAYV